MPMSEFDKWKWTHARIGFDQRRKMPFQSIDTEKVEHIRNYKHHLDERLSTAKDEIDKMAEETAGRDAEIKASLTGHVALFCKKLNLGLMEKLWSLYYPEDKDSWKLFTGTPAVGVCETPDYWKSRKTKPLESEALETDNVSNLHKASPPQHASYEESKIVYLATASECIVNGEEPAVKVLGWDLILKKFNQGIRERIISFLNDSSIVGTRTMTGPYSIEQMKEMGWRIAQ